MSGPSLWGIDWTLSGRSMRRDAAWRFLLLALLAGVLVVLVLSRGVDRFLSARSAMTAVLRPSVADEEGRGIASRLSRLPAVASAVHRSRDEVWRDFAASYPGLESLRTFGGNPLPGTIEVRLRPDAFSAEGIRSVEAALNPLPQVETVIAGGVRMHGLLRASRWINGALRAGAVLLALFVFAVFVLQERVRASRLAPDIAFLTERGVPSRRIAVGRAAAAAAAAAILAAGALAGAAGGYALAEGNVPWLRTAVGPAAEILSPPVLAPLALFPPAASALAFAASLLGWRAARGTRP